MDNNFSQNNQQYEEQSFGQSGTQQQFYQNQQTMNNGQYNGQYMQPNKMTGLKILILVIVIIFLLCCCGLGGLYIIGINSTKGENNNIHISSSRSGSISMAQFIKAADKYNYELYTREENVGYNSASDKDYRVMIDFYDYSSFSDSNYGLERYNEELDILDYDSAKKHSENNEVNSGEVTFTSNGCFYDVSYIDNTLVIGRTYESTYEDDVEDFVNNLGY